MHWEKVCSASGVGKRWTAHVNKLKLNISFTCTKINTESFKEDLNRNHDTKLLEEENIGKILYYNLTIFLGQSLKAVEIKQKQMGPNQT